MLQYVYNELGYSAVGTPTTDADLVALLNSMLKYGAAAQSFIALVDSDGNAVSESESFPHAVGEQNATLPVRYAE